LRETTASSTTTTFVYSGASLVAEYNGSTLLRRYVPGQGIDAPLVWYEGADLSTSNWLHADQLGRSLAQTNLNNISESASAPAGWR
jgi:hypothetical protein